jgi:hypothetical protein
MIRVCKRALQVAESRFVVQEHTTSDGVHWDLMLERGEVLMTFRMPVPPAQAGGGPMLLERIFDHPPRFLSYEGPVQKGTGRVRIVDHGTFQTIQEADARLVIAFHGGALAGEYALTQHEHGAWELVRERSD